MNAHSPSYWTTGEPPDWWFRCSWLCFSSPRFAQLPSPRNAPQGLKILTFSSSHPVWALKAKQAKQAKRKNWFPVFQFPDHCPECVCYSQRHFPFCLLHSRRALGQASEHSLLGEVFLIRAPPGPRSFPLATLSPLGWECPTLFPLGPLPLSWHPLQV